jgi:hypothetical protein
VTTLARWPNGCSSSSIRRKPRRELNPPRIELSRLTVSQYRNAIADLGASFRWKVQPGAARGLKAEYFAESRHFQKPIKAENGTDQIIRS